jgi:hypothetical protein
MRNLQPARHGEQGRQLHTSPREIHEAKTARRSVVQRLESESVRARSRKTAQRCLDLGPITHHEQGLHSGFSLLILDHSLLTVSQEADFSTRTEMRCDNVGVRASPFGGIS